MYSVSIRKSENVAVPRISPPTFAPATVFVRRIPNRISGSACRRSHQPNAASSTTPAAMTPIVRPEETRGEEEGHDAHRHVDEEDPRPTQRLGEHAAEQDAGRGAEAADRAPDAERDVALTALGERRRENRES